MVEEIRTLKDWLDKNGIFLGALKNNKIRLYNKKGQNWNPKYESGSKKRNGLKWTIDTQNKKVFIEYKNSENIETNIEINNISQDLNTDSYKDSEEKNKQFEIARLINNANLEETNYWRCVCVEYSIPANDNAGYRCGRQDLVLINTEGDLWFIELKVGYDSCDNLLSHYRDFCCIKSGMCNDICENIVKGLNDRIETYKQLQLYSFDKIQNIDLKNRNKWKTDILFLDVENNNKGKKIINAINKINKFSNLNTESELFIVKDGYDYDVRTDYNDLIEKVQPVITRVFKIDNFNDDNLKEFLGNPDDPKFAY